MELYIVDAFTTERFCGNQAGVALLGDANFPADVFMCQLAGELKHSETVFVQSLGGQAYHMRYFTPAGEVDLCGHATVAAFTVLDQKGELATPQCHLITKAGALSVTVEDGWVWMDMATPKILRTFTPEESGAMYEAYGLTLADGIDGLPPQLVSTGLADILLPVINGATLAAAVQQRQTVIELSNQYDAVGFHLFSLEEDCTARCRNFAPKYDIDEESATGTANGALTYYLAHWKQVPPKGDCLFVQGESMRKPSRIKSRMVQSDSGVQVQIGGQGVVTMKCQLV